MLGQAIVLVVAGFLGGTLNAVAGGGTFITFAALVFVGAPPVNANASSAVALFPGYLTSAGAYRREIPGERATLVVLGAASALGGIAGALLLTHTSQSTFTRLVPYLLLFATAIFALAEPLTRRIPARGGAGRGGKLGWRALAGLAVAQFVIATYGGYFSGGIGILMLAALGLLGMRDITAMNALKIVLSICIGAVGVVIFIAEHIVAWPQALATLAGALAGGYLGAAWARKVDPRVIRGVVIAAGLALTVVFFVRSYAGG